MNIGEINGVQVAVSPEAYEEIKKQKIIEENKILKEQQQELERYKNIIDKFDKWLLGEEMMFYKSSDGGRLIRYGETKKIWLELKGSDE